MADGRITSPEVIEAKQIVDDIAKVEAAFESLLKQMKAVVSESGNFRTQSQGNATLTTRVKLETEASAAIKERARLQNALLRQEARNAQVSSENAKNLAKERLETQLLNRENKESAILLSKYTGAYQKLSLQRKEASKTLRDLIAGEKASNKEIKAAQANFDKLDGKVRKADNAVRDSTKNVGNYRSALKGVGGVLRGLVGAFGVIEGLRLGFQFAKDSIEIARRAKGVEFAFQRLGQEGEDAFERVKTATRGVLSELNIKTALVDFDNFNISLDETNTLFEFLAVRSAQTGKSVDSLRDSLVEGLSKESKLRIDNLGISTAQLNAELERTPNFVQAVANIARTEIAEAGNILDDAANDGEKFGAALENLQVQIGKFSEFTGFLNFFTETLQGSADVFEAQAASAFLGQSALEGLVIEFRSYTEAGREANKLLIEEADLRRDNIKEINKQTNAYIEMFGALGPITEFQSLGGSSPSFFPDFLSPNAEDEVKTLAKINEKIRKLREQLGEGEFSSRAEAKTIQDKIKGLEAERTAILGVNNVKKTTVNIIEGTIAAYERDIATQKKFQREVALTAEEIMQSNVAIAQLQGSIDELNGAKNTILKVKLEIDTAGIVEDASFDTDGFLKGLESQGFDLQGPKDQFQAFAEARKNGEEAVTKHLQEQKNKQAEIVRNLFSEFSNLYGLDATKFANLFDSKTNDVQDYAAAAIELNNLIFNIAQERRDADLANARAALDKTLEDETKSDEQKAAAQAKFRKEEAKIKTKAFEADKKASILNIQIATAVAILQAYAQLGPIGGTIAGIIITALGIAQTAVVASKKPPKFFKGTENAPEGWAWTDEKGPELHTSKSGKIKDSGSSGGPRLKWLEKGDKIFTAERTRNIFKEHDISNSSRLNKIVMRGHSERVAYKSENDYSGVVSEISQLRNDVRNLSNRPIVWNGNVTAKFEQKITRY